MKPNARSVLHCGPNPRGGWGWGGGRQPLPIEAEIRPVHETLTRVSLRHACLAAGLLDDVRGDRSLTWVVLGEMTQAKWAGSVDRFLADAARVGLSPAEADASVADLRGAIFGWAAPDDALTVAEPARVGICPDLALTMGILGRRIGDFFIASRTPDYSWPALFDNAFEFDDSLVDAPRLAERPWVSFNWEHHRNGPRSPRR